MTAAPLVLRAGARLKRLRRARVVVIAPDRVWGELHALAHTRATDDVIVMAGLDDVVDVTGRAGVAQLRLRRCDRVEWLAGWHHGPGGQLFARSLERYAQAGGFGAARHVHVGA